MRKRDRHSPDAAESNPPTPEAQGDGEPSAPEIAEAADGREGAPMREGAGARDSAGVAEPDPHLDEVTRQLNDQRDRYLRLAAEYDNYRKRTMKERAEASTRGQGELVGKLLEAIDDLARFADIDPAATDATTLHKGIEMVEQKMLKVLGSAGLEVINPVDQNFDPTVHEAVATEPALSPEDDHTVARVFQAGYRFNGQLLRPARVVVKQWQG
jgi:molecular chaperone GrpE